MQHGTSIKQDNAGPTVWHLHWQAAMGREFFVVPDLYARVRTRLIEAHHRPGRVLLNYVLLPTEIHVISQILPGESIHAVARAVGNVVSRWVRRVVAVRSPLLAGPHRAALLSTEADLRDEVRMLAWRPVWQGLVVTPSHYPHASLRAVLGMTGPQGFDARPLLGHFGPSPPKARASLRACLQTRPTASEWRQWELLRGLALARSDADGAGPVRELHETAAAKLVAASGSGDIDGALVLLARWVCFRLRRPGTGSLAAGSDRESVRGRALVACLAVRMRLCPAASVARNFGRAKSTLSKQMAECRARPADRELLATPMRRIADEAVELVGRLRKADRP